MNFINISFAENVTTVSFKEAKIFDEKFIVDLGTELFDLASKVEAGQSVLLDFATISYISSSALGKLITMNKKLKERSCSLKLINLNDDIMEVFEITRLNKFFVIEKS